MFITWISEKLQIIRNPQQESDDNGYIEEIASGQSCKALAGRKINKRIWGYQHKV